MIINPTLIPEPTVRAPVLPEQEFTAPVLPEPVPTLERSDIKIGEVGRGMEGQNIYKYLILLNTIAWILYITGVLD